MIGHYKALVVYLFKLCVLKSSPKDAPASIAIRHQLMLAYFIAGFTLLSQGLSLDKAVLNSAFETAFLTLFVYGLTQFFDVRARFNQAMIAVYGSGAIITLLSVPFIMYAQGVTTTEPSGLAGTVIFLIVIWSFLVLANILRETLNKRLGVSLLITFCYVYLSYQINHWLFPLTA